MNSPFYQSPRQSFSASQNMQQPQGGFGGFQQPSFSSQIFGGGSTSPQSFGGFGGGQGGFGGGFQSQGFGGGFQPQGFGGFGGGFQPQGFGGGFQPQGFGGGFNPMFGGIGSLGLNPMMGPQFGMQMPQFQQQFNPYQQQQFNPYQQQQFNPYQQQFNPYQQQFQPQFNPFQQQQFNPYQQPQFNPFQQQFQPQMPQQQNFMPEQLQEKYGLRPYQSLGQNQTFGPGEDGQAPVMGDMMYRGGPPTARDMAFRRQREQAMRSAMQTMPQQAFSPVAALPQVTETPGLGAWQQKQKQWVEQTPEGAAYKNANEALEAFKKANPNPFSYSEFAGGDPALKAQYDKVYEAYQKAATPYYNRLNEYEKTNPFSPTAQQFALPLSSEQKYQQAQQYGTQPALYANSSAGRMAAERALMG